MIILHIITLLILIVAAIQDIQDKDNVSSWLFFGIPITMLVCRLVTQEKIDIMDSVLGLTLSSVFFIFACFGVCGGADAIMAVCIGFAYGFKNTAVFIIASCVVFLIYILIYSLAKKISVKEINRTSLPFIPAAAGGFVIMIILNYIIFP